MALTKLTQEWIHAIIVSPGFAQDGTAFAVLQSGLFVTADGGKTWQPAFHFSAQQLSSQLAYPSATAACLSPDFPNDRTLWSAVSGAILRSMDGARTWQFTSLGQPEPVISCLAVSPAFSHDQTVFAGSVEDGLFISSDSGASWFPWNFGLIESSIQSIGVSPGFRHDELVFAATETGLYRSQNSGRSWKGLPFPVEDAAFTCLALSPQFERDKTLLAGTERGLYISNNQGMDWVQIGNDIIPGEITALHFSLIDATKSLLLALEAGNHLIYSIDAGQTWGKVSLEVPTQQAIQAVAITGCTSTHCSLLVGLSSGRIIPFLTPVK